MRKSPAAKLPHTPPAEPKGESGGLEKRPLGRCYPLGAAIRPGDNCARALKSVVIDPRGYDWEGDAPLGRPLANSVIYEVHVGGFTRHPSSGLDPGLRGTYGGLIEKIPYLKQLGVTAVE